MSGAVVVGRRRLPPRRSDPDVSPDHRCHPTRCGSHRGDARSLGPDPLQRGCSNAWRSVHRSGPAVRSRGHRIKPPSAMTKAYRPLSPRPSACMISRTHGGPRRRGGIPSTPSASLKDYHGASTAGRAVHWMRPSRLAATPFPESKVPDGQQGIPRPRLSKHHRKPTARHGRLETGQGRRGTPTTNPASTFCNDHRPPRDHQQLGVATPAGKYPLSPSDDGGLAHRGSRPSPITGASRCGRLWDPRLVRSAGRAPRPPGREAHVTGAHAPGDDHQGEQPGRGRGNDRHHDGDDHAGHDPEQRPGGDDRARPGVEARGPGRIGSPVRRSVTLSERGGVADTAVRLPGDERVVPLQAGGEAPDVEGPAPAPAEVLLPGGLRRVTGTRRSRSANAGRRRPGRAAQRVCGTDLPGAGAAATLV